MSGWQLKSLGKIAEVQSGGTPLKSRKEYWSGDIPWYSSGELNEMFTDASKSLITEKGLEESNAKLFPKGSLLIGMYDTAALKMSILDRDAAFNQAIAGVKPNESIDLKFILHAINSRKPEILNQRRGVRQKNLSLTKIKNITLPIPPLAEQKRIVAILDEAFEGIEVAIANTENNLANARELFESYLNTIFTRKGDNWVEEKLGDICENLDSKRVPITKSKRTSGKVPYYGASGVVDYVADFIFDEELLLVSEDGANLLARTYPIAFSISGKTWVNNHAHVLRFKDMSLQKFIEYYLNSISLSPYVSGMAQPKLNQRALNSIPVPVAPKNDREQIVHSIDLLFSETQRLEAIYHQKLAALNELKQSILQKAFSGELTAETANQVASAAKEVVAA